MSDDGTQLPLDRHAWAEPGVQEVDRGVHRIPLPLPNDGLRAVNVYAIEDGDELVLVDSGWALAEAREQLEAALGKLGHGLADISRFLITHQHRDHYTLGITLRREFGAPVALGAGERPSLEVLLAGEHDHQLGHLLRCGAHELVEQLAAEFDERDTPGTDGFELPDEWIDGPCDIALNTRTLRAIPTPGHTSGHVVFADAESSLMFTGDHVLPHITPSIGLQSVQAASPLGDYLDSLRHVRTLPDMRMLPAHGPVSDSVHVRVDELLAHHDQRLELTERTVHDGAGTAYESAWKLGWTRHERRLDELNLFNRTLAVGETAAHLNVLVERGRLRSTTEDGVVRYAAAT